MPSIQPGWHYQVKSPRTVLACQMLGLNLKELNPVEEDEVRQYYVLRDKTQNPSKEFVDLRINMLDQRRYDKLRMIKEKRREIIEMD